jgi:hypothetical protein
MPEMIHVSPRLWKRPAGWLVPGHNCTELEYRIIERALRDDGLLETPLGSNRNPRIDEYTRRFGLEPPQYWCAIWVGCMWADAGSLVPKFAPDCDAWIPFVKPWKERRPGDAVLYGKPGDARHIGIFAREQEGLILTIEGNRGYHGSKTNNGVAVDLAPTTRTDILGVIHPRVAPT